MNPADKEELLKLVTLKMPFGKYKDTLICDLPVHYLEWFDRKGMPQGKLGSYLSMILTMKSNGDGDVLAELKRLHGRR